MNLTINFSFITLPLILLLCLITSYEDIKEGKIRNKWVFLGIFFAITFNFILFIYFVLGFGLNYLFFIETLTNTIFVILVGFFFWYYGIWSSGDGKLFIVISLLIPISVYSSEYFIAIPSLSLLINILFAGFSYCFVLLIKSAKLKDYSEAIKSFFKEFFKIKTLFPELIVLFAVFWVADLSLGFLNIQNSILTIIFSLSFVILLKNKFKTKSLYVFILIIILRLIFDKSVFSYEFIVTFLMLVLTWRFIKAIFKSSVFNLGQIIFTSQILTKDLVEGMILTENIERKKTLNDKEKKDILENSGSFIKKKDYFIVLKPKSIISKSSLFDEEDGITKDQVLEIQNLGINKIKIAKTMPFAPIIFIGTILTYLLNGAII
jgi:hypothetical protein